MIINSLRCAAYVKNYDAMRRELAQAKASSTEFKQYLVVGGAARADPCECSVYTLADSTVVGGC